MNTGELSHVELGRIIEMLKIGANPSDLHGSLIGYLCAGGQAHADQWLQALELTLETEEKQHSAMLEHIYHYCQSQLNDPDLSFAPLLPDNTMPLKGRAEALVEWCRGFLGGIGLADRGYTATSSAQIMEVLQDFSAIAHTDFEYGDAEQDEASLTEVIEFVRVGVLLLYGELAIPLAQKSARLH